MFTSNPFAELSAFVSPTVMQTYVVVMVLLVAGGTLFDIIHKKSARYFLTIGGMQRTKGYGRSAAEKWCPWRSRPLWWRV